MADFLTINNYAIGIALDASEATWTPVGASGSSRSGQPRVTRRAVLASRKLTTTILTPAQAEVVRALLNGWGAHFPFDEHLYSANGGRPNSGYDALLETSSPAAKYGTACLEVTSGASIVWVLPTPGLYQWTLMYWFWNGAAWDHYAISGSTFKWLNKVASSPNTLNVITAQAADGKSITVTFEGQNAAGTPQTSYYDDIVLVGAAENESTSYLTTAAHGYGQAWGNTPFVKLGGDITQMGPGHDEPYGGAAEMVCQIVDVVETHVSGTISGATSKQNSVFSFRALHVDGG